MRSRRLAQLLIVGLLLVGCAAPGPSPSVSPTPAPAANVPSRTAAAPSAATVAGTGAPSPTTGATAAFPMTVTDDAGRRVVVPKVPERIVSIAPSNTEILFALGLGDKIVGVDRSSNYPPEARDKTQVGNYASPSLEQIVGATPDLVLATHMHVKTVVPELEARRLTVAVINPKNLDETLDRIALVGRMTGQDTVATGLVRELRGRVDVVTQRVAGVPPLRVFFELSPKLHTAGPDTFVGDLIQRAGGRNVAADAETAWPQLSQEVLFQQDPEVVFIGYDFAAETPETVAARPGWQRLSAVKQGRIVAISPDLTSRAGPRVVDGLEAIARALHPDRFR